MSYPIKYPTPQGANVQIFTAAGSTSTFTACDWVKPQGASFVWFTLIGPGSQGDNVSVGGGSGAVTNFMCPAFLIPDVLRINVGAGGKIGSNPSSFTSVIYQQKDGTGYTLLTATRGGPGSSTGGAAMTANAFTAMGFFQSVAGQNGGTGTISASATTFLSGGSQGGSTINANYGYSTTGSPSNGFFQMQPIIVGLSGAGAGGNGGIGCGGGDAGAGGNGLVVIITW